MAWTLREHEQEPARLAHLLYWQQLLDDGEDVVYQNDHSLLAVFAYRGPDMESADAHELKALTARLHGVLLTLGAGWTVHAEARRHEAAAYQASTWSHPVAALVDEERRAQVGTPGTHFETTYHLALTWHIPRTVGAWWQRLWWENIPKGHAHTDQVTTFRQELARVRVALTGVFTDVAQLTGDALVTYLSGTVSAHGQNRVGVPEPPWYLNYQLTDSPLQPGVIPKLGDVWIRTILVKNEQRQVAFPLTTYPGILDALHDLPLQYRYVLRWIPIRYGTAKKELSRLENVFLGQHKSFGTQFGERMSGKPSDKIEQAADNDAAQMSTARGLLEEGVVQFGYLTLAVVVWNSDLRVAEQKREHVEQALRARGFLASVEIIDAVGAWLGTIPGDSYHNVEKPMLNSLNAAHLMATTSVWAGPQWVQHLNGPPLLVGTARGQTPFRLTTHEGDVGDFFCVGPKGAGKSAKLALMALQWQRYTSQALPPRVVALDKGASLKAATLAMDGLWVNLAPGTVRPLQPLARIHEEEERAWALEWLEDILEMEGLARGPVLSRELWGALQALVTFPVPQRTISGLCALVQSSQIRDAIQRYTVDGPFSLLDGDQDWLKVTHWTCFEMETLLDDFPRLVYPVAKVLFRRIETSLDGAPTFISLDECHAYFAHELLAARLLSWLKTFRRRNAILGFSTQNLLDLKRSPVGQELIQACPTRIYCPNPHATEPSTQALYEEFGLTPRQCQLIAQAVPKRDYYYQGRQGNRLFRIEMGPATLAFCGRSRMEDLARMDVVDRVRSEPFGVAWLRAEGLDDVANLLGESYENHDDADDTLLPVLTGELYQYGTDRC